jgi:hypothetical protein
LPAWDIDRALWKSWSLNMHNFKATLKAAVLAGTALLSISSVAATVTLLAADDNKQPVTQQPVTQQPVTQQPVSKQPVSKQPDKKQPDKKQPDAEPWLKEYTPTTTPPKDPPR